MGATIGGVALRAVEGAYDGVDRAHVAVRLRSCPFAKVERALPRAGDLLDVGCGHGHLALALAAAAPDRRVVGVDVDERKLALARAAASRLGLGEGRVRFEAVAPGWRPSGPVDAVSVVDALYLLEPGEREALVRACAAAVRAGGVVVLKEMDGSRRAKAAVARGGELVMTRLARITASSTDRPAFASPADLARWLAEEGLDVRTEAWDRGYPVPHVAVVGRRS